MELLATSLELDELHAEIERYLAAVEVFRSEGCNPHWSIEVEQRLEHELDGTS